ncbi:MAG: Ig-like domain-containing protein [Eubacterium sp.]|nr:Ig-like domain-containing protein [Eubacterium sp.]
MKKLLGTVLICSMVMGTVATTSVKTEAALAGSKESKTYEGHTYALFENEMGWKDAQEYCTKLGGHLVTITSKEENDFLVETFLKSRKKGVLIGFSDEKTEGNWEWITGEKAEYTNWDKREPNNALNEDFALMRPSGAWNDGHLEREKWAFICEWDCIVDSIQSPSIYVMNNQFSVKADENATYKSLNPKVVTVDGKGTVKALKSGKATIVVVSNGKVRIYEVLIKKPQLNKKKVKLKVGKSFKLKITGKIGKAKFASSKKKVAKVNKKGKIVAKKKGKAVIKVKVNGVVLKCKVTVK